MSYVPTQKQLQTLIKGMKRIEFFEWATRPLGFHFWDIDLHGYFKYYPAFIGRRFKYVFLLSKGRYEVQYRNKAQQHEFIKSLGGKLDDFSFLVRNEKKIARSYKKMWALANMVQRKDWRRASNAELIYWYRRYYDLYSYWMAGISTGILVSEAMANVLKQKLTSLKPQSEMKENVDLIVRTLSTPEELSMTAQEELALMKILRSRKSSGFKNVLAKHIQQWAYIPVYSQFSPWTTADYKKRIALLSQKEIEKRYHELRDHKTTVQKAKRVIYSAFIADRQIEKLANLLSKYLFWRINDETTIGLLTHARKGFTDEIMRRLYISPAQFFHMIEEEVTRGLRHGRVDVSLINERIKEYALIVNPSGVAAVAGKDLGRVIKSTHLTRGSDKSTKKSILQGVAANPGKVQGKIKIVLDPSLIGKVKRGDILVTTNTTPAYVVGMKIASAIVTEEGGITSHAAIVSRELGVPCVIGVTGITRLLKDGDQVEVDATKGVVKKI